MHLFDYLHCVFLDEGLIRENLFLLVEAGEIGGGHDVGDGAEAMEEHGDELDEDDGEEEEYQYDTYRLEVQVLLRDDDLEKNARVSRSLNFRELACWVK